VTNITDERKVKDGSASALQKRMEAKAIYGDHNVDATAN
jgi:hypothetical protein